MKLCRTAFCLTVALAFGSPNKLAADTFGLEQIRSLSSLPALDRAKLEAGEILSARGPLGNFTRGVYAESCYFVHAPVEVVGEKLLHWNPAKHAQLEIRTMREYRWPAAPNVWEPLRFDARDEDRWLIDRTAQLANGTGTSDLHLTAAEMAMFTDEPQTRGTVAIADFWRKILRARDQSIFSGGLEAVPAYAAGSVQIKARTEFESLLKMAPKIAARFSDFTSRAPFVSGARMPDELLPYWEAALVRSHTNLHAGFIAARKAPSWQLADCSYYVSDTYFFSVTFYELISHGNGTVVWQIDFASAPFRSFTGGLDRVVASKQMIKETGQTARLFRGDVEQGR